MTKLRGVFLQGGVANLNGRVYPLDVLESMKKQFGELNHPLLGTFDSIETDVVKLCDVSHKVNNISIKTEKLPRKKKKKFKKSGLYKVWKNKNCKLIGEIELLDTPRGKIAKQFINDLVVRPSGRGVIGQNGIVENYELTTFSLIKKDDDSFKEIIK